MDAIQKIKEALKKMPGDGPWRPEHRDALNEWRAVMTESTIREVLQLIADRDAEVERLKGMADEYENWIRCYHSGGDFGEFLHAALNPTQGEK